MGFNCLLHLLLHLDIFIKACRDTKYFPENKRERENTKNQIWDNTLVAISRRLREGFGHLKKMKSSLDTSPIMAMAVGVKSLKKLVTPIFSLNSHFSKFICTSLYFVLNQACINFMKCVFD